MIYKKFYFENYKGIKKISIELDKNNKLHCIVGINESGKTTILKAIETTYKLLIGDKGDVIKNEIEKIQPKISNFSGNILFGVIIELAEKNKTALKLKNINEIQIEFYFEIEGGAVKNREIKYNFITKIKKEKQPEILEYLKKNAPKIWLYNDFLEEIPESIIFYRNNKIVPEDKQYNSEINKKWSDLLDDIGRNSKIKDFTTFQKNIIDWKFNNPGNNNDENVLNDINTAINEKITNNWKKYYQKNSIKEIIINYTTSQNEAKYDVKIKIKGQDNKTYEIKERSLGFRWFFSFLLFTLFRKTDDALFLLDEPASNLYSVAQKSILARLQELAVDNQVIYTTHSPYLLDSNSIANGFLATNTNTDEGYESNIQLHPLKNIDIYSKEWEEYTKTLQDFNVLNLPNCYLRENNLFVEGFEDWILIRVFCDKMLNKLQNVSIIYGNGASSMDSEIKYSNCYSKKFLLILDNDKGGKDAKKHYENSFKLFQINNNIKKLNELVNDNNIKAIQSLIAEEDKKEICKLCNIEYNEKNKILIINACKNIYQQAFIDNNNKITEQLNQQLSQQTKDNFTELADAIEKHFNLK